MFCSKCGNKVPDGVVFCPMCGNNVGPAPSERFSADPAQPAEGRPVLEFLMSVLKDNLFLVICILLSVSVGFSIAGGTLPLINILALIFLWIIYAQSRKGIVDLEKMRNVSGVVYASYVLTYVLCGIFIFCGLIFMVLGIAGIDLASELADGMYLTYLGEDIDIEVLEELGGLVFIAIFAIIFVVSAAVAAIINYCSMGKIHKFVKSIYKSGEAGRFEFVGAESVKSWLMVLGVLSAISALGAEDFYMMVASGCVAAVHIIGSVIVKKYFLNYSYNYNPANPDNLTL